MENKIFNFETFCNFLYNFDAVKLKYDVLDVYVEKNIDSYNEIQQHEFNHRPTNLQKHNFSAIANNASIVYGDKEKGFSYKNIYKTVLEKIVLGFLSIPGLSSIYNEYYMEFEWNMHANLDFNNHRNAYYRDHFIHETRNLFMMFSMLEDKYIYENVKSTLSDPSVSKVSRYFFHQLLLWKDSFEANKWYKETYQKHLSNIADIDIYLDEFFIKYVIHASTAIACLFHDIGYPIAYHFDIKDRIIKYFPSFHSLISDSNFDFNYVHSVLEESLLFQFIDKTELKKRFEKNDHGTISAIILGVYFYKTGKIFSLPIEQQTAIEIGILAIYDHTLSFGYCKEKESDKQKTAYYKMQFALNPIAYLLRLCDDMQEWDREYFEIKAISNLLFCPVCKTPLIRNKINYSEYLKYNNISDDLFFDGSETHRNYFEYKCFCKSEKTFSKQDDFVRRKLINIKACDEVELVLDDSSHIEINFKYNTYRLLRLCYLQFSFFEYRQKEIIQLKKFVSHQRFLLGLKGYQYIIIRHNLSSNPMLLKMFILRDFIEASDKYTNIIGGNLKLEFTNKSFLLITKYANIWETIGNFSGAVNPDEVCNRLKHSMSDLSEIIVSLFYSNENEKLYEILVKNCLYYLFLYFYEKVTVNFSVNDNPPLFDMLNKYLNILLSEIPYDSGDSCRKELYKESVEQIKNTPDLKQYPSGFDKQPSDLYKYYNYLVESKKVRSLIEWYCDKENPISIVDNEPKILTYYTDLYMYEMLSEYTQLMMKKIENQSDEEKD